jgi:hypothetical protein
MTTDMSMKGLFIRNSFTNIKFDLVIQGIFPAYFLKIVVFKNQKEKKKESAPEDLPLKVQGHKTE